MKPYDPRTSVARQYLVTKVLERGILVWLVGNPGESKTVVAIDLAARITRGDAPGSLRRIPGNVLYIAREGAEEIGPRFYAAQGDWDRFEHIDRKLPLPSKLPALERLITKHKACLVILDPIRYFLEPIAYSTPDNTAKVLEEIADVAQRTKCTILCVDWPSVSRRKGQIRAPGNQSFTGVPRQLLVVGQLSADEWVIGVGKTNNSTYKMDGWTYTLESVDIGPDANGEPNDVPLVRWKGEATPTQVQSALEQLAISEDPNLRELLQLMSDGTWFDKPYLLEYLNNRLDLGKNKARTLLNKAAATGYLQSHYEYVEKDDQDGRKPGWQGRFKITDLGVLKLKMNEEMSQQAIDALFPPIGQDDQLALPATTNNTDPEDES